MLSSRFGPVVVIVQWQKISSSCSSLLASPSRVPARYPLTPMSCSNPVRSTLWSNSSFKGGHSLSPRPSASSSISASSGSSSRRCESLHLFRSSVTGQRQGKRNCWEGHPVNCFPLALYSIARIGTAVKSGSSYDHALSSCPCRLSVVMPRGQGQGQQRQHSNNKRNNSRRSQNMEDSLLVEAIAGPADPTANLDRKPLLQDELDRYGVDESDYRSQKIEPQEQDTSLDMTKEYKIPSSSMRRKRKATADLNPDHPSEEKSGVGVKDWCCYLLISVDSKKTYVGVTFDTTRRLRQHNGEIAGGAKSARAGRPWRVVCIIRGFSSRSEACQFEWRWKSTAATVKIIKQQESGVMESPLITRRRATVAKVLEHKDEWNYLDVQWHAN